MHETGKKSFEFVQVFGKRCVDVLMKTIITQPDEYETRSKWRIKMTKKWCWIQYETLSDIEVEEGKKYGISNVGCVCSTIWRKWFDPSWLIHVHVSLLKEILSLSLSLTFSFGTRHVDFLRNFDVRFFMLHFLCCCCCIFHSFMEQRSLNMDFVTCIQQCGAVLLFFLWIKYISWNWILVALFSCAWALDSPDFSQCDSSSARI